MKIISSWQKQRIVPLALSAMLLTVTALRVKASYKPANPQAPGLSGIFRAIPSDAYSTANPESLEETVRGPLEVRYTGNREEDMAIDLVLKRPDVADWYATAEKEAPDKSKYIRSNPVIEMDHRTEDGQIVVHAFDLVRDDFLSEVTGDPAINAHTATMDWFTVNPSTREAVSESEKVGQP